MMTPYLMLHLLLVPQTNRRKNLAAAHFQAGFRGHLVRQAVVRVLVLGSQCLSTCHYAALACHCAALAVIVWPWLVIVRPWPVNAQPWPQCAALACHCAALACHCVALACHCTALACHCMALACHCTALACHCMALACHCTALACHCMALACHCVCVAFLLQYSSLRVSFDELSRSCSTTTDLLTLSRFFLVFYKDEKDQERLVSGGYL